MPSEQPVIVASVSREWKRRMAILIAVMTGLGLWFLFDGLVAYPRQNVRAAAYAELLARHGKDTPELERAWLELCNERGWSAKVPGKTYTEGDIRTQIFLGILALVVAAIILVRLIRTLPTTTRLENGVIELPDGRQIPLHRLRAITKKRWESQSIAGLVYEKEDGQMGKFILDDYKYAGAADILAEAEKVVPADAPWSPEAKRPDKSGDAGSADTPIAG